MSHAAEPAALTDNIPHPGDDMTPADARLHIAPEPTVSSRRINDLDDAKAWIAEHDGRINALWDHQGETNRRLETAITSDSERLTRITTELHSKADQFRHDCTTEASAMRDAMSAKLAAANKSQDETALLTREELRDEIDALWSRV